MPSIGDIANDVARLLYESRIPVAIVSIVAVAVFAIVAWRLGWVAAARRHPARSGAVLAVALLVGLPVAWYLGSPLVIRTSLVEDAPVVEVAATLVAPTEAPSASPPAESSRPTTSPSPNPTPEPSPTPTPFAPTTVASGEFRGTDDFHFGRGTASIIEIEPGRYHVRLEDFSVRNGPDLYVYLSPDPDDYAEGALEVGTLKATDGSFGYDLPDGFDPAGYESVLIWCRQFSHLFAVAPLASG